MPRLKKNPKITVLMPVYNGEKYLKEAIDSILNQTFTDFEFLIINDGSTDNSEEIIKSYKDPRIKLIKNEENLGIIKTLNKGLDLAKGKYIIRMDADDISLSKRLSTQMRFMDKHPEIGISGTWAKILGGKNILKRFSDPEKIKTNLLFGTSMIHPSVIMNREKINQYKLRYNENYKHSEDYELWTRATKYFPIININKVLLLYRVHDSNTGKLNLETLKLASTRIRKEQLKENLKIEASDEDILIHMNIRKPENLNLNDYLDNKEMWFKQLIGQNKKTGFYKEPEFSQVLAQRWLKICRINADYDFKIWKIFWKSNLRGKLDLKETKNWISMIIFFVKCLLKNNGRKK